jgi:tryptophan 7-halogenase
MPGMRCNVSVTELPCDSAVAIPSARTAALLPYTRSTARKAGWQWRIPLQHRTGNGYVYCGEHISDDEAAATLLANLDGEALADPRPIHFTTGHRRKYWEKNVVAIGLSSGFMEPLESTSIWMIQSGIARLLSHFPDKSFDPIDRDIYNRLLTKVTEHIRDFLIAHYKVTTRNDSPFWDYVREMPIPERLREKFAVFANTGRTFREDEELFNDTSWFAVLNGQGMQTRTYDPVANVLSVEETRKRLQEIATIVQDSANYMPVHKDYIHNNCAA